MWEKVIQMSNTTLEQTITSPLTKKPIKGIFEKITRQGYSPRPPERAKHLVLAPVKAGKSTFGCTHPEAAVFDWECGTDSVKTQKALIFPIMPTPEEVECGSPLGEFPNLDPWDRYVFARNLLLRDARSGSPQFRTIVMDSVDYMVDFLMSRFCRDKGVENISDYKNGQAGWWEVRTLFMRELQTLYDAGYGLVLPVHLTAKTVGERVMVQPKIAPSFREGLYGFVNQIISFEPQTVTICDKKKVELPGGKVAYTDDPTTKRTEHRVVLHANANPNEPERGCRVEVPDGLVLPEDKMWETYAEAYNAEVAKRKAILGE